MAEKKNDRNIDLISVMNRTNSCSNDEGKKEVKLRKEMKRHKQRCNNHTKLQSKNNNEERAKGVVCVSTNRTSPFLTIAGFVNRNHSQYL